MGCDICGLGNEVWSWTGWAGLPATPPLFPPIPISSFLVPANSKSLSSGSSHSGTSSFSSSFSIFSFCSTCKSILLNLSSISISSGSPIFLFNLFFSTFKSLSSLFLINPSILSVFSEFSDLTGLDSILFSSSWYHSGICSGFFSLCGYFLLFGSSPKGCVKGKKAFNKGGFGSSKTISSIWSRQAIDGGGKFW